MPGAICPTFLLTGESVFALWSRSDFSEEGGHACMSWGPPGVSSEGTEISVGVQRDMSFPAVTFGWPPSLAPAACAPCHPTGRALGWLSGKVGAIADDVGVTCWSPTLGHPSAPLSLSKEAAGAAATTPVMTATETHTVRPARGTPVGGGRGTWGISPGRPAVFPTIPSSWGLGCLLLSVL